MSAVVDTFKKFKRKYPDRLVLFKSGRKAMFVGSDAADVSRLLGVPVSKAPQYEYNEVVLDLLRLPSELIRLDYFGRKVIALKREEKPPRRWVQVSLETPPQLDRFIFAHQVAYSDALAELKEGKAETEWAWFVFPRIEGDWDVSKEHNRGLNPLRESRQFLKRKLLADHLRESANTLLDCKGTDITNILGLEGSLHARASATLFALTAKDKTDRELFQKILDRFFNGEKDEATIQAIEKELVSRREDTPRDIILTDGPERITFYQKK